MDRIELAAMNNARWCDGMCRAHGIGTLFTEHLWVCLGTPPRFHSSAVTIAAGAREELLQRMPHGFKDGFHEIDFAGHGYSVLFEAHWIWSEPISPGPTTLAWKRVEKGVDLLKWEAGWAYGDDDAADHPRQFPPSLLADSNNAFMAGFQSGELVAGCILNFTDLVVGLSNTYAVGIDPAIMWNDFRAVAGAVFPNVPVVGYERGDSLDLAKAGGFEAVAPLRVWVS